jgi:hypothetical protein
MDSRQEKDTKFELVADASIDNIKSSEPTLFKDAEWCFQFFNNEPVVFAWSAKDVTEPTPLVIQLQPHSQESIVFKQNGMEFKIFPRQISEETKKQRAEQDGVKG